MKIKQLQLLSSSSEQGPHYIHRKNRPKTEAADLIDRDGMLHPLPDSHKLVGPMLCP